MTKNAESSFFVLNFLEHCICKQCVCAPYSECIDVKMANINVCMHWHFLHIRLNEVKIYCNHDIHSDQTNDILHLANVCFDFFGAKVRGLAKAINSASA